MTTLKASRPLPHGHRGYNDYMANHFLYDAHRALGPVDIRISTLSEPLVTVYGGSCYLLGDAGAVCAAVYVSAVINRGWQGRLRVPALSQREKKENTK